MELKYTGGFDRAQEGLMELKYRAQVYGRV